METKIRPEQWPFFLFAASLPFATVLPFRVSSYPVELADVMFVAAAAAWLITFVLKRRLVRSKFYFLLAAYAVAVTLSAAMSANPAFSSVKLLGKFYLIAIALLCTNSITSMADLKRSITAWLIGAGIALLLSLAGIVLFYFGFTDPSWNIVLHPIYGSLPPGNYRRIEGFFRYPSLLANFIAVTWMLLLLAFSAGWLKSRTAWVYSAVLFIVDLFTLTPGLGGIFATSGYAAAIKLRERGSNSLGRFVTAAGICVAAVFFIAASVTVFSYRPEATASPIMHGVVTPSHRAVAWQTAFETFRENPLFGRGIGMPVAYSKYVDPSGRGQILTDAHNTYISLLAESGTLGFAAFMGMIAFLTFGLWKMRVADDTAKYVRIFFLLALFDAFFYQSLTGSYEDSRHLWTFFGFAAAAIRITKNSSLRTINCSYKKSRPFGRPFKLYLTLRTTEYAVPVPDRSCPDLSGCRGSRPRWLSTECRTAKRSSKGCRRKRPYRYFRRRPPRLRPSRYPESDRRREIPGRYVRILPKARSWHLRPEPYP